MNDIKFTRTHEWIILDSDGTARVGITDHAQRALGDVVFVELPIIGNAIVSGEKCSIVESVKSASDVCAPIAGEVIETNELVETDPGIINKDSQNSGWLFKIQPLCCDEFDALMDASTYENYLAGVR